MEQFEPTLSGIPFFLPFWLIFIFWWRDEKVLNFKVDFEIKKNINAISVTKVIPRDVLVKSRLVWSFLRHSHWSDFEVNDDNVFDVTCQNMKVHICWFSTVLTVCFNSSFINVITLILTLIVINVTNLNTVHTGRQNVTNDP